MSKEIKFKYIWSNPEKTNFITEIFTLDEIEAGNQFTVLENEPLLKDYKLIARVQSTGLLDKNGKEIFKSDILKIYYEGNQRYYLKEVKWLNDAINKGRWDALDNCAYTSCEVIGNIYRNPELLGGKNG
jgi:hypothetical protein